MTLLVEFLVAAEIEASQAIDWYEAQETGLGSVLRKSIEAAISSMQRNPLSCPVVYGSHVRRKLVGKFPYTVFYTVRPDHILVYSVFHTSQNPIIWRGRID